MDYIYLKARAKINLALDVVGKRPDGYHDMKMIMQTVDLCDELLIKKVNKFPLKIVCNLSWLPCDERNLAYRAAEYIIREYGIKDGVFISLNKNIPVSAGLAGGSSDCAATLVGLRNLFRLNVSDRELMNIGKKFGADVPFCVMRGTALAEGVGDRLTPLPPHPPVIVLIARPAIPVSTAHVFGGLELKAVKRRPDVDKMIQDISDNDVRAIASGFSNVLENVTVKMHPVIADIKKIMLEHGALGALMSGSGPTVFGYYTNPVWAKNAKNAIKFRLNNVRDVYITRIFNTHKKE